MGAYSDRVMADGAVAYWKLDETSGTTAVDSLGGNNGTISGGVTLNQPGAVAGGTAMKFAAPGLIMISTPLDAPQMTIEAWAKLADTATTYCVMEKQATEVCYEVR